VGACEGRSPPWPAPRPGLTTAWPAGAVTGNFQPDFEHQYVGLIVFYDANGEFLWRCSGSLLTDTVLLTAGHR
jgi:hypothetical protein